MSEEDITDKIDSEDDRGVKLVAEETEEEEEDCNDTCEG